MNTFAHKHDSLKKIFDVRNIIPAAAEPVYGWKSNLLAVGYLNVNFNVKSDYHPTYFVQNELLMRNVDYEGSIMSDGHLDTYLESWGTEFSTEYVSWSRFED